MSTEARTRLETFTEQDLPDLDEVVLGALEYLETATYPELDPKAHERPLVVGSGNALQVGKLLFQGTGAHYAEEGVALTLMNEVPFDALYIISASGEKHAIPLVTQGVASGLPTYLVTTNANASASKIVGRERSYIFPHIREPYTYNTSTYLSMLFGMRRESPKQIAVHISDVVLPLLTKEHMSRNAFLFTVQPEFGPVRKMFETKFDELFGPYVLGRSFTTEEMKHAKTVVTAPSQCFVYFGEDLQMEGEGDRLVIPLFEGCGPAALIAIGYYIIGHIQKNHPPYFKERIAAYVKDALRYFGHSIPVIVE